MKGLRKPWWPSYLWTDANAWVTMGKLAQFKCIKWCCQVFNKEVCKGADAIKGEEVMTLRPEEQGRQKLFVETSKTPRKIRTVVEGSGQGSAQSFMEEEWVEMYEMLKQVTKTGEKQQGRGVAGLGKVA